MWAPAGPIALTPVKEQLGRWALSRMRSNPHRSIAFAGDRLDAVGAEYGAQVLDVTSDGLGPDAFAPAIDPGQQLLGCQRRPVRIGKRVQQADLPIRQRVLFPVVRHAAADRIEHELAARRCTRLLLDVRLGHARAG
jgi:hypothetical protein